MSYSWVDPHFAVLYGRREDERLTRKLLADARTREQRPEPGAVEWTTARRPESRASADSS